MNEETLKHIQKFKYGYMAVWVGLFIFYAWLLVQGFKYVGYLFLVEPIGRAAISMLWASLIFLTAILSWTFVWVFFIDEIIKRNKWR